MKKTLRWTRFALALGVLTLAASQASAQPVVVNGDFEAENLFTVWPGYTGNGNPDNITGWTGEGGRGINPVAGADAPFRDNGNNDTQVAFIQGTSYIEQVISGFTVGSDYILSLDFNARNCCGDLPIGIISLNGIEAGNSADLFPAPGGIIPAGDADWYTADIEFTAPTSDITLRISTMPAGGGDSTMIVDNVSIAAVPEPSSVLLMGLGLVGLGGRRRRR